ncbi:septum formation initiator family protein [Helicobacter sp. 12S02634-8]|uniref:septum formation initiator family protein n=1 Tax=Helicobacter sp. 12S02634-8 TaxID=1476199 RepID=UPI00209BF71E|nr:septum formation initiator family protein [Helicobacter sp. 12S02634-8]
MLEDMHDHTTKPSFYGVIRRWIRVIYVHRVMVVSFLVLMCIGAYMGYLLFGVNSLEVLIDVKNKRTALEASVQTLQYENAKLQKQLFELKGLEP